MVRALGCQATQAGGVTMTEIELLKDFYTKVKAMREYQRAYFKTRNEYALGQAKNLEYEVDKTISMLDDTGQGDLFEEAQS